MGIEEMFREIDANLILASRWLDDEANLRISYDTFYRVQANIGELQAGGVAVPDDLLKRTEQLAETLYSPKLVEKALGRAKACSRAGAFTEAVMLYADLSSVLKGLPETAMVEFEGALIGLLRKELHLAYDSVHSPHDKFSDVGVETMKLVRDYRGIAERNGFNLPRDVIRYYEHVEFELLPPPRKLWRSMLGKKPPEP